MDQAKLMRIKLPDVRVMCLERPLELKLNESREIVKNTVYTQNIWKYMVRFSSTVTK